MTIWGVFTFHSLNVQRAENSSAHCGSIFNLTLSLDSCPKSFAALKIICAPCCWRGKHFINQTSKAGISSRVHVVPVSLHCVCVCVCRCRKWKRNRRRPKSGMTGMTFVSRQLTLWSLRGGRTIVLSMVFSTIFHSSFRTRFSTVFSQILAKSIKLQRQYLSVRQKHSQRAGAKGEGILGTSRERNTCDLQQKSSGCLLISPLCKRDLQRKRRGRILFFFFTYH